MKAEYESAHPARKAYLREVSEAAIHRGERDTLTAKSKIEVDPRDIATLIDDLDAAQAKIYRLLADKIEAQSTDRQKALGQVRRYSEELGLYEEEGG